jgi:hypothetical protein
MLASLDRDCSDRAGQRAALPEASPLAHLLRLSDETGLFEHAIGAVPNRVHGYCTDDVARGLIVLMREPALGPPVLQLAARCLTFLKRAALGDGRFHNRLSCDGTWLDRIGSDDCAGRALWALGTTAGRAPTLQLRRRARHLLECSAGSATPSPRANAFAALGAVEVLRIQPRDTVARSLLERMTAGLVRPTSNADWPWPEERLAYDNARLPQALLAAGATLGDRALVADGLRLLRWLVETESNASGFSFAPVGGWAAGEPRPGFDQQPLEAAAFADACAWAWEVERLDWWAEQVHRAAQWFLGRNDTGATLFNADTQGCHDGLGVDAINDNQGAESTVSMISAFQQSARMAGPRTACRGS